MQTLYKVDEEKRIKLRLLETIHRIYGKEVEFLGFRNLGSEMSAWFSFPKENVKGLTTSVLTESKMNALEAMSETNN